LGCKKSQKIWKKLEKHPIFTQKKGENQKKFHISVFTTIDKPAQLWYTLLPASLRGFLCCVVRVLAVFFGENRLKNEIWGVGGQKDV